MKRSDLIPPFLLSPYLFILDSANKKYVDDATALIYSDWVTFEHTVTDYVVSSSRAYSSNVKDVNGNSDFEIGHNFVQIQASETFYSDNTATLMVGTLRNTNSFLIEDDHSIGQNTDKSGKGICIVTITSTRSSGGSLCNVTVTGKYRYIDFKN